MLNNPIESYRRTQRELRREFDAFTKENCPYCPTPCCLKPARMEPVDIKLAEQTGWKSRVTPPDPDEVIEIEIDPETGDPIRQNCDYLTPEGCSFPRDLMPFGCTAYICKYMHVQMSKMQLNKIKRLIRNMEDQSRAVLKSQK